MRPEQVRRDAKGAAAAALRDVVFTFSFETLRDAAERGMERPPDRLLETLMASQRVGQLVAVDALRSVVSTWVQRRRGGARGALQLPDVHNISPLRFRRRDPSRRAALIRTYRRYEREIRRDPLVAQMDQPVVLTCNPFVAAHCEMPWAGDVAFFARDDWAQHIPHRRWWPEYEAAYRLIGHRRRTVFAVTSHLLERIAQGRGHVVPNGIDPREWTRAETPPDWFTSLPRPRILYSGGLDSRLDTEALQAIADRWPAGSLVLLGMLADPDHMAPVLRRPNVTHRHERDRSLYAALVSAADVCIIPHHETLLTKSMSPLKLYEYLAAGRPVVATDLPGTRDIDPRVLLVEPGGAFAEVVAAALSLEPVPEEKRLQFLADNSWASRYDTMLEAVLG